MMSYNEESMDPVEASMGFRCPLRGIFPAARNTGQVLLNLGAVFRRLLPCQ